jgi:hypothetical protein
MHPDSLLPEYFTHHFYRRLLETVIALLYPPPDDADRQVRSVARRRGISRAAAELAIATARDRFLFGVLPALIRDREREQFRHGRTDDEQRALPLTDDELLQWLRIVADRLAGMIDAAARTRHRRETILADPRYPVPASAPDPVDEANRLDELGRIGNRLKGCQSIPAGTEFHEIAEFVDRLPTRERRIALLYLGGGSPRQIAHDLGLGWRDAGQVFRTIRVLARQRFTRPDG